MNSLVSIIVPVFNPGPFFTECIESILCQTYKDIEIILVDDGSTDNSPSLCDLYASNYPNVFAFHNTNHGVSYSRNFGISKCKGDYIAFVDSDDYIDNSMIEKLMMSIKANDLAICRFNIDKNGSIIKYFETNLETLVANPLNVSLLMVEELYIKDTATIQTDVVFGSTWRCLFKKALITKNSLKFNESLKLGEDLIFVCNYLLNCKSISFVDEYLYNYRKNSISAVATLSRGYVENFAKTNYLLLLEKISIVKRVYGSKSELIDYLIMKFTLAFAINELKMSNKKNSRVLNDFFGENPHFSFKIKNVHAISQLSLKRRILLGFLKFRAWNLLYFALR